MNSVERVKQICKDRKIAISRLERDLGFANGYISQLKKGVFPDDRIFMIAEYLSVSVEFIRTGEDQKEKPPILGGLEEEFIMLIRKLNSDELERELGYLRDLTSGRDK